MSTPPTNGEQLSAWLDGELTDAEAAEIERELDRNPLLRAELDELRGVRELLRTHGAVKAPDDFLARVLAEAENEPLPANNANLWRWLRRPFGIPVEALAVAAAALLVVVAGLDLGVEQLAPPSKDELAQGSKNAPESKDAPEAAKSAWDQYDVPVGELPPPEGVAESGSTSSSGLGSRASAKPKKAPPVKGAPVEETAPVEQTAAQAAEEAPAYGSADASGGEKVVGTASTGTGEAVEPAVTGWRYQTTTDDADILVMLQRLAGKFGGKVLDARGRAVTGGAFDETMAGSYLVQIPTDRLLAFDDAVRGYGLSQPVKPETRSFASEYVLVQVDITWMHAPEQKKAPATKSPPTYEKK